MLKLTTSEGCSVLINPSKVFAVVTGLQGQVTVVSDGDSWIGVKEPADEVGRIIDEANNPGIPGILRPGNAWTPPEVTPIPGNPYGVKTIPLNTGLDGANLSSVRLEES